MTRMIRVQVSDLGLIGIKLEHDIGLKGLRWEPGCVWAESWWPADSSSEIYAGCRRQRVVPSHRHWYTSRLSVLGRPCQHK